MSQVIKTYKLTDGKTLTVNESECGGMAGELMTIVILKINGLAVHLDDVKSRMDEQDAEGLEEYLDGNYQSNLAAAIAAVI